jgi:hypothetical protein
MSPRSPLLALVAGASVLVSLSLPAQAQLRMRMPSAAPSYFPLAGGNHWVYRRTTPGGVESWEVAATATPASTADRARFTLSGYFLGAPRLVAVGRGDRVTEKNPTGEPDLLWYLLGAPVGTSWKLQLAEQPTATPYSGCVSGSALTVASRNETVAVPAGVFRGVVRIDFRSPCADAGISSEWFAPGVGLVRREEQSIAGPVVSELTQAKLVNRTLPADRYETSLSLDRPILVNNLMPATVPPPLPVVSGAIVVRNATDMPVVLTFSGCRSATLTVTDSEDRVVLTTTADDGGCCQCDSLERLVLLRDSLVLPFSFTLAGEDDEPLTDRWYSLEATLDTLDPPPLRPAARARIEVQTIY